jgi:hypothetical protein
MRRAQFAFVIALVLALPGWLIWAATPAAVGQSPTKAHTPVSTDAWMLAGSDSADQRRHLLSRAGFQLTVADRAWPPLDECHYLPDVPSGTTPKFDCVFAGGETLKVKYGGDPELYAEVAASRLLTALGYGADDMRFVERIRCYGCPRMPFLTEVISASMPVLGLDRWPRDRRYTDFTWVTVERRPPLRAVETADQEGWAFWELPRIDAPVAELDAMRLLAVFLAHWDNKAENQRLVCLDDECRETVAMLHDVGATFGPYKVNLSGWSDRPIWADRRRCFVSMKALPWAGATFPDAEISEAGRALFASRLDTISDDHIRQIFRDARFPQFHAGTDDDRDLDAWVAAFRSRADQIRSVRCPQ